MTVLENLPNEIFSEIFSYLSCADFATISHLSHHMHALSQPLLYTAPDLTRTCGALSSIHMLLRTLLSPGGDILASYVRSLDVELEDYYAFDYGEESEDGDGFERPGEYPREIALLEAAATPLGLHRYLKFEDAQLVLLLHYLPRLYSLNICLLYGNDTPFSIFMATHNPGQHTGNLPPGLQQLRLFRCTSDHHNGGVSPVVLLTLLSLPSIQKIDVQIADASSIDFDNAKAAVGTSTVTNLRFSKARMSQRALWCILKIPVALTSFTYSTDRPHPEFLLGIALLPLRLVLQHLHLECGDDMPTIGSLREWPALRTLSCSLNVLLGRGQLGLRGQLLSGQLKSLQRLTDVLPSGLRRLGIQASRYWTVAAEVDKEVELLSDKESLLPGLETLAVVISPPNMAREVRFQNTLRMACEASGVQLVDIQASRGSRYTGCMGPRRLQYRNARPDRL